MIIVLASFRISFTQLNFVVVAVIAAAGGFSGFDAAADSDHIIAVFFVALLIWLTEDPR